MSLRTKKCRGGIQIAASIQPRSSRNEVSGLHNGALKIRLTSPPVDGEANRTCIKFIAKWLGIRPSQVSIVSGHTGRNKTIQLEGMDEESLLKKLPADFFKTHPEN